MFSGDSFLLSSGSDCGSQETITVVPVLCFSAMPRFSFWQPLKLGQF